ncbi:hypothetical protein BJY16_006148 [Actinoplanes octamycinicus]|uniref:Uncharacterized protein n=1 Tax=Actinoplanes octamycinicus TaxID=135948 RepID=A0A7W7H2C7_9ACTN|nr:hypothetical protein [Actinoplanes octamycinicus]MBB4742689.1 hypothetical protein [Actinoplanes octamycinicus]GIE62992.1 hypothetical protein Aoc01nite_83940 [Actinoplanes octamycinicus]
MTEKDGSGMLIATTGLAEAYGVSETRIASFIAEFEHTDGCTSCAYSVAQHGILLAIADEHRQQCVQAECRTCTAIRCGLEVAMAVLHIDMETALRDMSDAVRAADAGEVVAIGRVRMPLNGPYRPMRAVGEDTRIIGGEEK